MPKARYKASRIAKSVARRYSFKLGNRKSAISAHFLPTEELLELYFNPRINKDKPKIMQVLYRRGVTIPVNLSTEDETITNENG